MPKCNDCGYGVDAEQMVIWYDICVWCYQKLRNMDFIMKNMHRSVDLVGA